MSVSNRPAYGRIRRGPMAADAFTQIRNALFRDPRLSLKDKGLFGLISTHRDGWGVTPESLATCCADGVSAIKSALRNLERHGYLQRHRERRADGTLGSSSYFITDQPDAIDASDEGTRRSEPTVGFPPVDEPSVADHPHKKTNSKKTILKNTLSPPAASEPTAEAGSDQSGRETGAPPTTTAERVIRTAAVVTPADETAFTAWITDRHTPRGPGWWRTTAANGDLADLAAAWRAEHAPATTGPPLPAWCGQCGDADVRHLARLTGEELRQRQIGILFRGRVSIAIAEEKAGVVHRVCGQLVEGEPEPKLAPEVTQEVKDNLKREAQAIGESPAFA